MNERRIIVYSGITLKVFLREDVQVFNDCLFFFV